MSVRQRVVALVTVQEDAVVEAEQGETRPAERKTTRTLNVLVASAVTAVVSVVLMI